HTGDVFALAVSPDGKRLVSGSLDQTLRLWDIAKGKLLLSIFYGTDNEWVAWTPQGFYDASPKGDQYVGWRVNRGEDKAADFYTASQFRRYLYRPDIIRDTLAMGSSEQAIKNAGLQHITVEDLILRAPVDVSIASAKVDPSGKADISVRLGKNKTTLPERVTIYVNGAQILSNMQRRLSGVKAGETLHYTAQLNEPRNHIRVTVENKWAENSAQTWVENPSLKKRPPVTGTLYVHGIGVSRYPNLEKYQQLYSPPLDAKNIVNRFKKLQGRLYKKVVVNLLTDADGKLVTTPAIVSFLNRNVAKAGPGDTTIIFLAGHGITDDKGDYRFITADTQVITGKEGQIIPKRGTSFDWTHLHKILDRTRGKRMVIVDTCQAGKVLRATKTDIRKLVKDIHDVNAIIHTGTSRQQIGLESPEGGVFTQSILAGLDGQAEYKDGRLLFVSLQEFVAEETPKRNIANIKRMFSRGLLIVQKKPGEGDDKVKESEMTFDTTQHPVAVVPKGMESFIISRE
ncbi:MAG: caspase family protein, partial [Nitrospinales bacterium]